MTELRATHAYPSAPVSPNTIHEQLNWLRYLSETKSSLPPVSNGMMGYLNTVICEHVHALISSSTVVRILIFHL